MRIKWRNEAVYIISNKRKLKADKSEYPGISRTLDDTNYYNLLSYKLATITEYHIVHRVAVKKQCGRKVVIVSKLEICPNIPPNSR